MPSAKVTRLPGVRTPTTAKISSQAVDNLRALTRHRVERPFEPAQLHPPRAVPEDLPAIAQDDSAGFALWSWAQSAMTSSIAEGTTFLGYAALSVLAQRAEYRVISEEIASEMTREWIELKSVGDEDKSDRIKELDAELQRLGAQDAFRKAALSDGFFGRGHIYLDTGDTDDRDELKTSIGDGWNLLSRAKIGLKGKNGRETDKKLRALRSVEPVWCYPTQYDSNDPLKADWYTPTTWHVMGKEVHVSRLLTLIGREVPDLLKPAYSFGGLSMSQMAKPYVDNWLRTRQAVSDVVNNFSCRILETPGVAASLTAGGQEIFHRAEIFNQLATNTGIMLLGTDEKFSNVTTPLGGLEQLQAQSQEHMAAVSRIPLVKLLGIQPAGLNASSEGEIRSFYDWIKAFQELLFRKPLRAVLGFAMLSLWGEVDPEITFDFKDLWQLDEAAKVSVEKTKTDIDDANIAMGSISAEEVRQRLANDKDSQYASLNLDPDALPEPPASEEMGGEMMGHNGGPDLDDEGGEPPEGGPPKTAGRIHDPHDLSERVTYRAGNVPSPTGGFGGGDAAFEESKHPRSEGGQFTSGSSGAFAYSKGKNKPLTEEEKEHAFNSLEKVEKLPYERNPNKFYVRTEDLGFKRHPEGMKIYGFNRNRNWGKEEEIDPRSLYRAQQDIPLEGLRNYIHHLDETLDPDLPHVAENPEGERWVLSGHTRLGAQLLAGRSKVPVVVHRYERSGPGGYSKEIRQGKRKPPKEKILDQAHDAKLSHADVAFEHPARGPHHCSECAYFEAPAACELVESPVAPEDWCERFLEDHLGGDAEFKEREPRYFSIS